MEHSNNHVSMAWNGIYGQRAVGPRLAVLNSLDRVREILDNHTDSIEPGGVFGMADYGCADGLLSLPVITAASEYARGRECRDISVYLNDLPTADFNTLFSVLNADQLSRDTGIASCVLAAGGSFTNRVLPRASVDFGFSASSMHYLEHFPPDATDAIHEVFLDDGAIKENVLKQAGQAWLDILRSREQELKPGGNLVFLLLGRDEQGRYLGSTQGASMFQAYQEAWDRLFAASGITQDEYQQVFFLHRFRTTEEIQRGVEQVRREGVALQLLGIETVITSCPIAAAFRRHHDERRFAQEFVDSHWTWTEHAFRHALQSRAAEEAQQILDDLYRDMVQIVAADPLSYRMDLVHHRVVLHKNR
ncbi:hypothetical protein [Halomonas caseinilytica]|uniref:hypothetical protein n=1 Tax=Halomonas caseinilytica TaxID=438744 RepID=UPI0008D7E099|nr:hypothetical protein [Halomonas caseinilytica]SEN40399.1 SAM dependent carboxyl methyltransferase [Halomonas caseinilytica]